MSLSSLFGRFMKKLPDTECETCLRVRYQGEKMILAVETSVSKALGFKVGEEVDSSRVPEGTTECMEFPRITGQEIVAYRTERNMSQEEFAQAFGLSLATVQEWEQSDEGLDGSHANKADLANHRGVSHVIAQMPAAA